MSGECTFARIIAVIAMVGILSIPSLDLSSGDDPATRAGDPDLAILEIWTNETRRISCHIANLGGTTQGQLWVNLSLDGTHFASEYVDWLPGWIDLNLTFPQYFPWYESTIKVDVVLDYITPMPDDNLSNNQRSEIWERDLPDLVVRSLYRNPENGNAVAVVQNIGDVEAPGFIYMDLKLEGISQPSENIFDPIPPGDSVIVPFMWVWDRFLLPVVNITVKADLPNDIAEMNETNNEFKITWAVKIKPSVVVPPKVIGIGKTNATINTETSVPSEVELLYGKTSKLGTRITDSSKTNHNIELTELEEDTQYHYTLTISMSGEIDKVFHGIFQTTRLLGTFDIDLTFTDMTPINLSRSFVIPIHATSERDLKKIDIYIGGKLIQSFSGMKTRSLTGLTIGMDSYVHALYQKFAGSVREMLVVVHDSAGSISSASASMSFEGRPPISYPTIVFSPSDREKSGFYDLVAICRDPVWVNNATWFVDGELLSVQDPLLPESRYWGARYRWDTTRHTDGVHTVAVFVTNWEGNTSVVSRDIEIRNYFEPLDPSISVSRGNIERDGSVCTVPLTVRNWGPGAASNIEIADYISGFVPIAYEWGTRPIDAAMHTWEVWQSVDHLDSGESITLRYQCVPILDSIDVNYQLGLSRADPTDPGAMYTTYCTYHREDGLVTYEWRGDIPTMNFQDGALMEGGALSSIGSANYVMLTSPGKLISVFGGTDDLHELMFEAAKLTAEKNGVFGFIFWTDWSGSMTPEFVKSNLDDWSDLLHSSYHHSGYLAILGERNIIPNWDYDNVYENGDKWMDVQASDHGYSNIDGGNEPMIIVGRFIGRTIGEMMTPVNTSVMVSKGEWYNDPDGSALVLSGAGNMVKIFEYEAGEITDLISPDMSSVELFNKSDYLDVGEFTYPFEEDNRFMIAGDFNTDGRGELIFMDVGDETLIERIEIDTGVVSRVLRTGTEYDRIMAGDFHNLDEDEVILVKHQWDGTYISAYSRDGYQWSRDKISMDEEDGICIHDYDPANTKDEIIIADASSDRIRVLDKSGSELHNIHVGRIGADNRIAVGDMDNDGSQDFVIANHQDDKLYVYLAPDWRRKEIRMWELSTDDGFAVGDFTSNSRDEAVVIHGGEYQRDLVVGWIDVNSTSGIESAKWEEVFVVPEKGECSITVTEMLNNGGNEEIVFFLGGTNNKTYILDYGGNTDRFKADVLPHMSGKDLIVYTDHGSSVSWSGLFRSGDAPSFGLTASDHRPVMFGMVCQSGRYHQNPDNFAVACLRNGAGVYIGSTTNALGVTTSRSSAMIDDYAEGYPIGVAMRNFERIMIRDPFHYYSSAGQGRLWVYQHNLYGDPAFGTHGLPYAHGAPPLAYVSTSRSSSALSIEVEEPIISNIPGIDIISFANGSHMIDEGGFRIPFITREFTTPDGMTIDSLDVRINGTWEYYYGLDLPSGEWTDIRSDDTTGRLVRNSGDGGEVDPDIGWDDELIFNWNIRSHPSSVRTFMVDIYPFQYDPSTRTGRFCGDLILDICLSDTPAVISDFTGPMYTIHEGANAIFTYDVDPVGDGGSISISQWIEGSDGTVVDELTSMIMNVNTTTTFSESWVPPSVKPDSYVYMMEMRNSAGSLVDSVIWPFTSGTTGINITRITVEPSEFTNDGPINVSVYYRNIGSILDEFQTGILYISLLDSTYISVLESNSSIVISSGESSTATAVFDTSTLTDDRYFIRFSIVTESCNAYETIPIIREGSGVQPEPEIDIDMDFNISSSLMEFGSDLWVNGTVSRSDMILLEYIPVAVYINDTIIENSTITGENGTFWLRLSAMDIGNWTVSIFSRAGIWEDLRTVPITVIPVNDTSDDDDDVTDDDTPDDDDNITDDDDVTDDDSTGDDTDGGDDDDGFDNRWLVIILLIIMSVLILLGLSIYVFSKRSAGADGWEE